MCSSNPCRMIARDYEFDGERIAQHYPVPVEAIQAAFHFYEAYREEIDQVVEDNNIGYDAMKRLQPHLKLITIPNEDIA